MIVVICSEQMDKETCNDQMILSNEFVSGLLYPSIIEESDIKYVCTDGISPAYTYC
jgi:hypothetical protein